VSTRIKCPDHKPYNCLNCPGRGYLRASDHLCVRCGRRAESWQHRVAAGKGGPDDLFNCVPLCGDGTRGCHGWAESRVHEARKVGLDVEGSFLRGRYVGPDETYRAYYNREEAA
jgi:hypothetical protein